MGKTNEVSQPSVSGGWSVRPVLWLLTVYRYALSPYLGPRCRFAPSCSEYAATALERFGLGRGLVLSWRRIRRCHPFGDSGFDPVPEELHEQTKKTSTNQS